MDDEETLIKELNDLLFDCIINPNVFQVDQSSWLMSNNPEFIYEIMAFNYNSYLMDQDFLNKLKVITEPILKSSITPHVSLEKQLEYFKSQLMCNLKVIITSNDLE